MDGIVLHPRTGMRQSYGKAKSGKHSFGAIPECLFSECVISAGARVVTKNVCRQTIQMIDFAASFAFSELFPAFYDIATDSSE